MTVPLKVCLRQLPISTRPGLKSRRDILRLPQKHCNACFHSHHPAFVKQVFCSDSNQDENMEQPGHKQHTSGVTVSHPQVGPSSCRKTSSGLPLILHYGELYNYFTIYYSVVIEIKCTINVIHLNHPETILTPQSMEKLSSTKPVPGVPRRWGPLGQRIQLHPSLPCAGHIPSPFSSQQQAHLLCSFDFAYAINLMCNNVQFILGAETSFNSFVSHCRPKFTQSLIV